MQAEFGQLAKYRIDKARECLTDAQAAFEKDRLANSINRSYYAVFHATRALLALDGFDSKKHSAIIGYFNQHYVATGKIEASYYQQLSNAFRIRNKTDYDDFYIVSRDDASKQLQNAQVFVGYICRYIESLLLV
jgi:uncharacterized protein (UPF0332 family)